MSETKHLKPLFEDEADYARFTQRHNRAQVSKKDIRKARGKLYLGIDAGSTTTKAALIDEDRNLLFQHYMI